MSRAALLAAAAVALLVAGCVACAWIEGAPLVPADAGRADGGRLGIVFLALLVAAFAAYLVALALLRRRPPGLRAVLLVAFAIQVVPLAGPLLLSTDAWTYWEYGRIAAVHDGNPYVDVPSDYPDDPSYEYAGAAWRDTTSVYGPLFTSVSGAVAVVSGSSAEAAAWIFKTMAALAVLACVLLAARLATRPALRRGARRLEPALRDPLRRRRPQRRAHDRARPRRARTRRGEAPESRRAGVGRRRSASSGSPCSSSLCVRSKRAPPAAGSAIAASPWSRCVLVSLATWRYGFDWLRAFGPLARNAEGQTSYALSHRVEQLGVPHGVALALAGIALVGGLAWLVREAARGRARLGLSACLLLATTPWLAPWYTIWALPLAAAEDDRRAQLISLGFCAYLLPQTIPL